MFQKLIGDENVIDIVVVDAVNFQHLLFHAARIGINIFLSLQEIQTHCGK